MHRRSRYRYQWTGNLTELKTWLQLCGHDVDSLDPRHDIDDTLDIYTGGDYQVVDMYDVLVHDDTERHIVIDRTKPVEYHSVLAEWPHVITTTPTEGTRRHIATAQGKTEAAQIVASLNTQSLTQSETVKGQARAHAIADAINHLNNSIPDIDHRVIEVLTQFALDETRSDSDPA